MLKVGRAGRGEGRARDGYQQQQLVKLSCSWKELFGDCLEELPEKERFCHEGASRGSEPASTLQRARCRKKGQRRTGGTSSSCWSQSSGNIVRSKVS